ncbi:aspartate carbamoyltransferase [Polycladomyces abyssicola]|uniref:Aspartate carbamoyltransferase n=1 Tax=Polycladomyces abyssicola TaxID=1125966 RepID=A0A8D5UHZ7_9BACL|nr:aspartate carbamoyltransferase catalytic subunit [Polycladomyces abyssicola]BCU82225.1 aspartate carbamoyltransferase [Polycladomyces abyssicola]
MNIAVRSDETNLIDTNGLSRSELMAILERARFYEDQNGLVPPRYLGRFVANLFFEPSTRTRFSFEVAEKRLGLEVLNVSEDTSSTVKGETLADTLKTLAAIGVEVAVIRHSQSGIAEEMAKQNNGVRLVNAGDGHNAHPTQALLDLYTLHKHFGDLNGLRVAIIGDLRHSRVARSNLWSLTTMGAEVVFSGPETMRAPDLEEHAPYLPIDEAIAQADAVMMLRVQLERHREQLFTTAEAYHQHYGLTLERFARMQDHAVILHPGPVNRDVELADELVEHPRSKVFEQMKNGVWVRMAVLERVLEGGKRG